MTRLAPSSCFRRFTSAMSRRSLKRVRLSTSRSRVAKKEQFDDMTHRLIKTRAWPLRRAPVPSTVSTRQTLPTAN
jgi:hypothetical protein